MECFVAGRISALHKIDGTMRGKKSSALRYPFDLRAKVNADVLPNLGL